MKAIFTNISGVLSDTNSFRDYIEYYYLYNDYNIDDSIKAYDQKKFDLLSEICKENNASVVLSSSWRYYYTIDERFDNELIRILKEFKNHEIPFYGFTPEIENEKVSRREIWFENNIYDYLNLHPEVEDFCILTPDEYSLDSFDENLVITEYNEDGFGTGGLLPHHKEEIGKILKRSK